VSAAEIAVKDKTVVAAASSNRTGEPAVRGAWLDRCRLFCAVGSTRVEQVEADAACFLHAQMIVVDTLRATGESGDLRQPGLADAAVTRKVATMAQLTSGEALVPRDGLIAFKSVGTALQDLALAVRCYEKLRDDPRVPQFSELVSLKPRRRAGGMTSGQ
jgi:ornithine cyclodeaminase/alanine dehydrogenase